MFECRLEILAFNINHKIIQIPPPPLRILNICSKFWSYHDLFSLANAEAFLFGGLRLAEFQALLETLRVPGLQNFPLPELQTQSSDASIPHKPYTGSRKYSTGCDASWWNTWNRTGMQLKHPPAKRKPLCTWCCQMPRIQLKHCSGVSDTQ